MNFTDPMGLEIEEITVTGKKLEPFNTWAIYAFGGFYNFVLPFANRFVGHGTGGGSGAGSSSSSNSGDDSENGQNTSEEIVVYGRRSGLFQNTSCRAVTANGCGPADFWYSFLIPNTVGGYDFTEACNKHDMCLAEAEKSFEQYNSEFYDDLESA